MTAVQPTVRTPEATRPSTWTTPLRLAVFLVWLAAFAALVVTHAPWRDEVRALSLIHEAADFDALVRAVRAEGHPPLWYGLLALADGIIGGYAALVVTASTLAVLAFGLLILRSPLPLWSVALIAASPVFVMQFGVIARNYGISFLLMLALADVIARGRAGNGALACILLFLLPLTNVHSVILTPVFGMLWARSRLSGGSGSRQIIHLLGDRTVLAGAACALAGALLAFLTVYPPVHDYAMDPTEGIPMRVFLAIADPGWLMPVMTGDRLPSIANTILLIMLVYSFRDEPDLALATAAVILALVVTFAWLYPGAERHQALALAAVVAFAWIAEARNPGGRIRATRLAFAVPFAALFAFNLPGFPPVAGRPFSMSAAACEAIEARPELRSSVIVAEPQWLVEALPHACPNPTFLGREGRPGAVSMFRRDVLPADWSMRALIETADALARESGAPVVVLLGHRIDWANPATRIPYWPRSYIREANMHFSIDPESAAEFRARSELILPRRRTISDEHYDVFVFR